MVVNKNIALLYGIMLGDGCLTLLYRTKKLIVVAGSMADDIPFFKKILQPLIKKLIDKSPPIRPRPSKGAIYLHFFSKPLFDSITDIGFPIGKKGINLHIPKIFYRKKLVKYTLQGFFATDGSLVLTDNNGTLYPRIEANGISKSLIKEISEFLNSKGIHCKFYKAKRLKQSSYGYPNRQEQYRLQVNGKKNLKKFVKLIGFINPKQKIKYGRYLNYLKRKYGCGRI